MINFSDITYIKNCSKIGLINSKSSQFLCYDKLKNNFKGNGINPYLQLKEFGELQSAEFIVVLSSNPNSQNVITYGNQISLMTKDLEFITCLNNGEIKLEGLKNDKSFLASNIPVNAKLSLIDPYNQSNFSRPLLYHDKIILRSNFGNFLMIGLENNVSSAGMIISEETTWKLTKTNVDQFPDWLKKRKYLNHNNISYLYNLEKFLEQNNSTSSTNINQNMGLNLNSLNNNFSTNAVKKTKNLLNSNLSVPIDKISLMTLSLELQEKCLIEDLLLVMLGREGVFIKRSNKKEIVSDKNNNINNNPINNFSNNTETKKTYNNDFSTTINSLNNSTIQNNIFKNFSLKFEIEPYLENPTCGKYNYLINPLFYLFIYKYSQLNF